VLIETLNNFNFYFELESVCIEEGFLVNGPNPLPDAHFSASSSWDHQHYPFYAKLDNKFIEGVHYGTWCPASADFDAGTSYIQVRPYSV